MKLDDIDRAILRILQTNAKITNAQLSKEIGLSPAPTLERVKKLEQAKIISSYHAKLDNIKIGLGFSSFVLVSLKGHNQKNINDFVTAIGLIDEVIESHHVTGSSDFILKIVARDIVSYQKIMTEKISDIDIIDTMESMVIMSTHKESEELPMPF